MWAAQFIKFDKPHRWMTSGGLGTMGYGMPSAMGVQVAHPEALTECHGHPHQRVRDHPIGD